MAKELLEDNHRGRICLEEAIAMQPRVVCYWLLAVILLTNKVAEPHILQNEFKARLCNDIKYKLYHISYYQADQKILKNDIYNYGLWDLNRMLVGIEKSFVKFPPISFSQQQWSYRIPNPFLQTEQYNIDEIATLVNEQRAIFNSEQATAFDAVLESVINNQGHLFFIHTAGGCGKIFLCNTIAVEVRRREQVVLCIASSGIAALLLDRERISHLYFKISLFFY